MFSAVTSALTQVLTWIGTVVSSITGASGDLKELLPLFAIGIAISVFLFGIKAIKSIIWGA